MSNYESIRVHPIFDRAMSYQEHYAGNLSELGDALGRDCQVLAFDVNADMTNGYFKSHTGDGSRNEDWYTFGAKVLSPITGTVTKVFVNNEVNQPGSFVPSQASSIVIKRKDNVFVTVVHVKDILIDVGDEVVEGQLIAYGGNNGFSRAPHVHVGAWKDGKSLQVEFDLLKMGEQVKTLGEVYYVTGYTEEEFAKIR